MRPGQLGPEPLHSYFSGQFLGPVPTERMQKSPAEVGPDFKIHLLRQATPAIQRLFEALVDFDPRKSPRPLSICEPENQIDQFAYFRGLKSEMTKKHESALEVGVHHFGELRACGLPEGSLACRQFGRAQLDEMIQIRRNPVPQESLEQLAPPFRRRDVEQFADRFTAHFDTAAQPPRDSSLIRSQAVREVLLRPACFLKES